MKPASQITILAALLKFEFRLWFRDYPFYLTTLLFFFYWFYFSLNFDYDPNFWGAKAEVYYNAPIIAYFLFSSQSFVNFFVVPLYSATPALRDFDHQAWSYLHNLPVRPSNRFWTRFFSGFAINLLSICIASSAILIAPLIMAPAGFSEAVEASPKVMDVPLAQVGAAWLILVFPNIFFSSAIIYALSIRYRRLPPVLIGTFALVLGTVISRYFGSSIDHLALLLSDATAFHIVHQIAEYWTVEQRNVAFLPLTQALIVNRLFWIAIGFLSLYFAYRWAYRWAHPWTHRWNARLDPKLQTTVPKPPIGDARTHFWTRIGLDVLQPLMNRGALWPSRRPLFRQISWELKCLAKDPFLTIILFLSFAWVLLQDIHIVRQKFEQVWPTTSLMLEAKRGLWMLTFLFVPFIASTSIFRERSARIEHITGSLAISTVSTLVAKFFSVAIYCLWFPTLVLIAGVFTQCFHAYLHLDFSLYLFDLYGHYYLFLARNIALAFFLAGLFSTKLKGYAGTIALLYVFIFAHETGVWTHEFLAPSYLEKVSYSVFSGLGPHIAPAILRWCFWGSLILLLLVLNRLTWVRGPMLPWRNRLRHALQRWNPKIAVIAIFAIGGMLGSISAYDQVMANQPFLRSETKQGKPTPKTTLPVDIAAKLKPPTIRHFELHLKLDEQSDRIVCTYEGELEIQSESIATQLQAYLPENAELEWITLDNRALSGESPSLRLLHLPANLNTRSSQTRSVKLAYSLPWFRDSFGASLPAIFLDESSLLPSFGKTKPLPQSGLGPTKPNHKLRPRHQTLALNYGMKPLTWDIGVSAPPELKIWAPGHHAPPVEKNHPSEFRHSERRFFSSTPDRSRFQLGIAHYHRERDSWESPPDPKNRIRKVEIEVLAHPKHQENIQAIVEGTQRVLSELTSIFGPYPYQQIRVVETSFLQKSTSTSVPGLANLIVIPESEIWIANLQSDRRANSAILPNTDRIDFVLAQQVAAHWWHNRINMEPHPGMQVLQAGLPNYVAARMVEDNYSSAIYQAKYHSRFLHTYFWYHGIHGHQESNLLNAGNNQYVSQKKAIFAFRSVAEQLHSRPSKLDTIFASFLHQHMLPNHNFSPEPKGSNRATLDKLYQKIIDATPAPSRAIIEELFNDRITYQIRLRSAQASPLPRQERNAEKNRINDAKYQVSLELEIQRLMPSHGGSTISLPWRGKIAISLLLKTPKSNESMIWPHLADVNHGVQTIHFAVPYLPKTATIDPNGYFLDPMPSDQVRSIEMR